MSQATYAPLAETHQLSRVPKSKMPETGTMCTGCLQGLRKFLRSGCWQTISTIALFTALFASDVFEIKQVPTNKELDVLLTVVLGIFVLEFIGQNLCEAKYPFSFFFWMDIIGTVSMAFDISYMLGPDVTIPKRLVGIKSGKKKSANVMIVRAARAARLGARAGRLSRVMKLLRFMPFMSTGEPEEKEKEVRMAKVISNKLNDALSMRVSLLTISIAVLLPVFGMFDYPETDDSMTAWTQLLALSVKEYLKAAKHNLNSTEAVFQDELQRCSDFYEDERYGPFKACAGRTDDGVFTCISRDLDMKFRSHFDAPLRRSSIWEMSDGNFQLFFSLASPKKYESIGNIVLICFIILVMICFGMLMSANVAEIALKPLERMLSVVRDKCTQIFSFTGAYDEGQEEEKEDEDEDAPQGKSEIDLLEQAVKKLTVIASLHHQSKLPEWTEAMDDDDVMKLNLAGHTAPSAATTALRKQKSMRGSIQAEMEMEEDQEIDEESLLASISDLVPLTLIESLSSDNFNSLDLSHEEGQAICRYLLFSSVGCGRWVRQNVEEQVLNHFIKAAEGKYLPNPFHNWSHGMDVLYGVSRFLSLIDGSRFFSEDEQFAIMLAAVGHDLGHIGVNNQYLIETSHKFAVTYNDRSPLENMHCSELFHLLQNESSNVLRKLEKPVYKEMRKCMIEMVLHTDMVQHMPMVKELNLLYHTNEEAFSIEKEDESLTELLASRGANHQLVLNMMLHTADVSNPMKPWSLCKRLALLCMDEYFAQGDLEKQANLPVGMLNDRQKVNLPQSQIGFVEFMIAPLAEAAVQVFPQLNGLATHLSENIQNWCDIWVQESKPPQDALEKTQARVKKVCDRCMAVVPRKSDGNAGTPGFQKTTTSRSLAMSENSKPSS